MSGRFYKLLAFTFVIALVLSGCNLIQIDETLDNAEVVASFNGGTLTKGEVKPQYNTAMSYYQALSSMYGVSLPTDDVLENVVNSLVQNKVLLAKAAELGLDSLTEEEEAAVQKDSQDEYEQTVQTYWSSFATDGLTDEEIRADVENFLAQNNGSMETVVETNRQEKIISKLKQYVYDQVVVTPEELQNGYDEMVASDETTYADLSTFESTVDTGGTTIAWYPEGYRTVKNILLSFTEEQQGELSDLQKQISDVKTQMDDLADDADGEAEPDATDASEDSETPAPTKEELQAQLDALNSQKDEKIAEFTQALQPKIDEIYERLEAGDDFDALIEEYNEDPGMQNEPGKSEGYYVTVNSKTWEEAFRNAAMALKNIGNVSEPVATNYGIHIIRYESDVTPGAVPYEEIEDEVKASVTEKKQNAAYDEQVAAWIEEANVQIDLSVMEEQ